MGEIIAVPNEQFLREEQNERYSSRKTISYAEFINNLYMPNQRRNTE